MYHSESQRTETERYERKLQLIQAVRAEHQANQQRIRHRNHLFYNTDMEDVVRENAGNGRNPDTGLQSTGRTGSLALRACISLFCVLSFWCLKNGKIEAVAGIGAEEIKTYVSQDFSKVVVDYMKNFTYTLNYEKTSIK